MEPLGDLLGTPWADLAANRPQEAPKMNQAAARRAHGVQFDAILGPFWDRFGYTKTTQQQYHLKIISDTILGSILDSLLSMVEPFG